jgi:uncharacterized protein (TIGR02996 family)
MSTDLRALLAAIVADPADDTARLVYADCLEEHGYAPRAEFIRLQVEAERLHPDSNARGRLEEQAQALFASQWIDWWGEVCDAVGLPRPVPKPHGAFGRLVGRVGMRNTPGHPYVLRGPMYHMEKPFTLWPRTDPTVRGLNRVTFSRGFPDSLGVSYLEMNPERHFLQPWHAVAPLADLFVTSPYTEEWIDGPHLAGLQSLTLDDPDPVALLGVIDSQHLARLQALTILEADHNDDVAYSDEYAQALNSPRMRQLKSLNIPLWSDRAAELVADNENLAGLVRLEVNLFSSVLIDDVLLGSEDLDASTRRIERLARSPNLASLRELKLIGALNPAGATTIVRNPTWTGLRKLDLHMELQPGESDPLTGPDDLPELEELRVSGVLFSVAQIAALARSPLLKRLRHFAVRGGPPQSVDIEIAEAVDMNRIETFAIGTSATSLRVIAQLRERFGDRLKLLD